jgi:hypothetical protein
MLYSGLKEFLCESIKKDMLVAIFILLMTLKNLNCSFPPGFSDNVDYSTLYYT